ncbi:hypothetical protein EV714DRAFT_208762 [Schizophyllum commune]
MRTSTLSSVDSQVPSLPNSPATPEYPQYGGAGLSPGQTGGESTSPDQRRLAETPVTSSSGLNPSTSRFMLSLPLLGRPKVPLEQVVKLDQEVRKVAGKAKGTGVWEGVTETSEAAPQEGSDTPKQEVPTIAVEAADDNPAAEDKPSTETQIPTSESAESGQSADSSQSSASPESQQDNADIVRARETQRSASWWDYVGWGYGYSQAEEDEAKKRHEEEKAEGATDAQQPSESKPPPETVASAPGVLPTQPEAQQPPTQDATPTTDAPKETPTVNEPPAAKETPQPATDRPEPNKALSVHSTAGSAYWYLPWAWYYGSGDSDDGKGDKVVANGEQAQASLTDDERAELTAAERVKEAALARDREQEGKVVAPPAGQRAQTEAANGTPSRSETPSIAAVIANPVATIVTSRSGWASFFTSNRTLTRRIEDVQRDENGMEVMEIGDEEGEGQGEAKEVKEEIKDGKEVKEGKDVKDGKPTKDVSRPGSASSSSEGVSSVKSKAPTLVISDDVKAKAKEVMKAKEESRKGRDGKVKDVKVKEDPKKDDKDRAKSKSRKSSVSAPRTPPPPNLVLPTWQDTFHAPPRSNVPPPPPAPTKMGRVGRFVRGVLFNADAAAASADGTIGFGSKAARKAGGALGSALRNDGGESSTAPKSPDPDYTRFGMALPRALELLPPELRSSPVPIPCKRCVVIGIHGWFPGAMMRSVLGEPTGTSPKFVSMMVQALDNFQREHNVVFDKVTQIPLEGEGMIEKRVEKLYGNLMKNEEWVADLHAADAIFVATHSQGTIVSTHLLDRLVRDGHIRTKRSALGQSPSERPAQKVCCLALCGIHLGPLRYLNTSSLLQPYLQYFESDAARELFEFQNTENAVSKAYVAALKNVLHHGIKMVYVASLNDQVVPIYSGLFTYVQHPLILRALYMDGDAYHSSDFLSNLLVLLLRVLNSGLSDSGLITHLSEATAGSLTGVGHSTAYEDLACFGLAAKYLFLTDDGMEEHPELALEPFNATSELNDYEIPWSLRDLIADDRVAHFFGREISHLRDAFKEWHPRTAILRDVKRKLSPIQRLRRGVGGVEAGQGQVFHSISQPGADTTSKL